MMNMKKEETNEFKDNSCKKMIKIRKLCTDKLQKELFLELKFQQITHPIDFEVIWWLNISFKIRLRNEIKIISYMDLDRDSAEISKNILPKFWIWNLKWKVQNPLLI